MHAVVKNTLLHFDIPVENPCSRRSRSVGPSKREVDIGVERQQILLDFKTIRKGKLFSPKKEDEDTLDLTTPPPSGSLGYTSLPETSQAMVLDKSEFHASGHCTPCLFHGKGLCKEGDACDFCHEYHEPKKQKKSKKKKNRFALRPQGVLHATGDCTPCLLHGKGLCKEGDACDFCHEYHEPKKQNRFALRPQGVLHATGECDPCYFHVKGGCRDSDTCAFCHKYHEPSMLKEKFKKRYMSHVPGGQRGTSDWSANYHVNNAIPISHSHSRPFNFVESFTPYI